MPGCEVWDIVRVPFPYTNRPVQQHRPALVVARPQIAGGPRLLWVVMVTSAANRAWPTDTPLSTLAGTGLPAPSVVRATKIATIAAGYAERIGTLPEPDRAEVSASLRDVLRPALATS
jgi:mRNA interferase MazF